MVTFVFACVVGKNLKTPNFETMADDAITWGGTGGLGSPVYIYAFSTCTFTFAGGVSTPDWSLLLWNKIVCQKQTHNKYCLFVHFLVVWSSISSTIRDTLLIFNQSTFKSGLKIYFMENVWFLLPFVIGFFFLAECNMLIILLSSAELEALHLPVIAFFCAFSAPWQLNSFYFDVLCQLNKIK